MNPATALLTAILVLISTAGRTAEPIRIGVLLSMDGPAGYRGRSSWKGIRAAHGLQPRVLGRPVHLIPANTHSEPSQAACAFFRLVEKEGVSAVIGDVTAGCTSAAASHAEKRKVPLVSLSGPVHLSPTCRTYTIWTGISAEHLGRWCAAALRNRLSAKTAAIVQDNSDEFAIGTAAYFAEEFKALGGTVVLRSCLRTGQSDMGTILEDVKRTRPDALFVAVFPDQCALLAKQAHYMGVSVPICAAHGESCLSPDGGRSEDASCGCLPPRPGSPGQKQTGGVLVSRDRSPRPEYCGPWERAGADAYLGLLQAIGEAQAIKGEAVCNGLTAFCRAVP